MGYEDRDYYREEGKGAGAILPDTMFGKLIFVTVILYLMQIIITYPDMGNDGGRLSPVQEWLELRPTSVLQGQIWRLVTYVFVHPRQEVFSILFGMLLLYWLGNSIEPMIGSREFLRLYLTGALCSSLCHQGVATYYGAEIPMMGSGGAIMCLFMAFARYYPRAVIRIYWIFPIEVRWLAALYVIFDLHPVLLALSGDMPMTQAIGSLSHLGGGVFGFCYAHYRWRLEYWTSWPGDALLRIRRWWRRPRLRVLHPEMGGQPATRLEDEMDRILQKISSQGEVSLTEKERQILAEASRQLRSRKSV